MIKPEKLNRGDKIAVVSLSWGGLGDEALIHKFHIAKERLENDFGLEVVVMPHTLSGSEYVYNHPEDRAKDLMDAFLDKTIKGIFCAIGGDDTIRTLPYIDFEIIRNNPKIFMGYSDTTINHFMMNKAGLVSYYGPSVMCEFGEYVKMFDNTIEAVKNILFEDSTNYEIVSSEYWSDKWVPWSEKNRKVSRKKVKEVHGYEVLQGKGVIHGVVLGGCIDVFPMMIGTEIWVSKSGWTNKILLIETSEDKISPDLLKYYLRNLGAQGIFDVIKGIIVGKPIDEKYYEEYKDIYSKVMKEYNHSDLPILYNINIGHAFSTGIMPLGVDIEIDLDNRKIKLLESATSNKNPIAI